MNTHPSQKFDILHVKRDIEKRVETIHEVELETEKRKRILVL